MSFAHQFLAMLLAAVIAASGSIFLLRRRRRRLLALATEEAKTPYGHELASLVADRLERGDVLSYRHRDYCGLGLRFVAPEYIYDRVLDGELPSTAELPTWHTPPSPERRVFPTRAAFLEWLAPLTDNDLSGQGLDSEWFENNQRITRHRLISFAHGEPVPWS